MTDITFFLGGATSISSYTMNTVGGGGGYSAASTTGRRSFCARPGSSRRSAAGEAMFSSWRNTGAGRQRRTSSSDHHHGGHGAYAAPAGGDAKSMENLQLDTSLKLPSGCSPAARKSICSVAVSGGGGGGGHSPRGNATLFTKWKVKDPAPLYIT